MTVKELITILNEQNKDALVWFDIPANEICFSIKGIDENLTNNRVVVLTNNVVLKK
jgi:hypothetical protein